MKNKSDTEKKSKALMDAMSSMGSKAEDIRLPEHVEPSEPWPRPEAKIDTGGPAYPRTQWTGNKRNESYRDIPGMTLRDYFAIHASENDIYHYLDVQYTRIEARYKFADAMIEARRGK